MKFAPFLATIVAVASFPASAQHDHHAMTAASPPPAASTPTSTEPPTTPTTTAPPMDHGAMDHEGMDHTGMSGMHDMGGMDMPEHAMQGALGPYVSAREASGTSWQPDTSTHGGLHAMQGDWMCSTPCTTTSLARAATVARSPPAC